jgi:V-type H+-transporting ATPase subunit a
MVDEHVSLMSVIETFTKKEKAIYEVMNRLKSNQAGSLYFGYFWSHVDKDQIIYQLQTQLNKEEFDNSEIQMAMIQPNADLLNLESDLQIEEVPFSSLTPPTYIRTNEVTWVFQQIVNTYGVPNYREINPAFFAVVTFPFLFGVMFGDMCHGSLLFLFAIYLCLNADSLKKNNSRLSVLLPLRYALLLMGFFASYMGFIYNDFMSIPMRLFGLSCYEFADGRPERKLMPDQDCVYPFGMDPAWMESRQEIAFYNSFKMKTSVILGVAQMTLGIILKGLNANFFNNKLELYHEVIPQMIMLMALFGFMDMVIIQKWLIDWKGQNEESRAPSVVNIMIEMFMNGGEIKDPDASLPVLDNQARWSKAMLILVIICPPWMLLVKPLVLKNRHE